MSAPSPDKPKQPPAGDERKQPVKVGGTEGGGASFLIGLALLVAGGWLFISRISVRASGARTPSTLVGWAMLPIFIGVALLFFNGRSRLGWLAVAGGIGWMMVGVFSKASLHFKHTGLGMTLLMFGCVAAGLGLIFRAVR